MPDTKNIVIIVIVCACLALATAVLFFSYKADPQQAQTDMPATPAQVNAYLDSLEKEVDEGRSELDRTMKNLPASAKAELGTSDELSPSQKRLLEEISAKIASSTNDISHNQSKIYGHQLKMAKDVKQNVYHTRQAQTGLAAIPNPNLGPTQTYYPDMDF